MVLWGITNLYTFKKNQKVKSNFYINSFFEDFVLKHILCGPRKLGPHRKGWSRGLMDKALPSDGKDCEFKSCRDRCFFASSRLLSFSIVFIAGFLFSSLQKFLGRFKVSDDVFSIGKLLQIHSRVQ